MSTRQKRYRGVILTTQGRKKLESAILAEQNNHNWGERYSIQQLADRTQLSPATIRKILDNDCLLDKSSIRIFFRSFGLKLLADDYEKPKSEIVNQKKNDHQDWGLAVDVSNFYGQEKNIATLTDLIREKNYRLILLLGMGGTGKTFLSVKIAQLIENEFDFIIWRSLKYPISSAEMINDWLSFLTKEQKINGSLDELVNYLRRYKCLLILDNLESILEAKNHEGTYQENYKNYRRLLEVLGNTNHQSCLIISSREKPEDFYWLEQREKISALSIKGEGYHLINFHNQLMNKSSELINEQHYICHYYDNNYIFLEIVIKYINKFFHGQLDNFIAQKVRLFKEISAFLDGHFERLSPLEIRIIRYLNSEENDLDNNLSLNRNNSVSNLELSWCLQSLIERSLIIQEGSNFTIAPIIKQYLKSANLDS